MYAGIHEETCLYPCMQDAWHWPRNMFEYITNTVSSTTCHRRFVHKMNNPHPLTHISARRLFDGGNIRFMKDRIDYDCVIDDGNDRFIDDVIDHVTYDGMTASTQRPLIYARCNDIL